MGTRHECALISREIVGALDDIDVDCGGTSFEKQVWNALRAI
jgi:hypothetical protein